LYQNGQENEGTGSLCISKGHQTQSWGTNDILSTVNSQKASVQSPR